MSPVCSRTLAAAAVLGALLSCTAHAAPPAGSIYAARVDSIIHPVSAEYMIETMDRADRARRCARRLHARNPWRARGLDADIVTRMLAAKTPVAVFVAPAGARAASAGFILTIAADVAAMAPGTHIGAAHPVSAGGEKIDEVMAKKAAEDVAAYVRTLANGRQRNVTLAAAGRERQPRLHRAGSARRVAAADRSAWQSTSPTCCRSSTAGSVTALRRHGRRRCKTAGAAVVPIEMSLRQRVLSAIAHPNIAYLLLSLGMLGLTIELWSPGAVLPGVVGGYRCCWRSSRFQLLPVNYAGLLLILLGLLLLDARNQGDELRPADDRRRSRA